MHIHLLNNQPYFDKIRNGSVTAIRLPKTEIETGETLVPNPSMKCRGSVEIASRMGENLCAVTLYWHEYGGCTVVAGV
jgi:hypothetical protein